MIKVTLHKLEDSKIETRYLNPRYIIGIWDDFDEELGDHTTVFIRTTNRENHIAVKEKTEDLVKIIHYLEKQIWE